MLARTSLSCRLARGQRPVVAILDAGLSPTANLPAGTHVLAARSFVGQDPWVDNGTGGRVAAAVAETIAGRWTPSGSSEVGLVIVQVCRDGVVDPEALRAAARWLSELDIEIDAVAVRDARADTEADPWSRRLARAGIRLHGRFLPHDAWRVSRVAALAA